ncbi:Perilipin-3 [Platysternon megacephalum]|uniref:Perilipin-3 n=1 Tax=Platysternon megacephalum TaxID=55544 RepID=A0A4D9ECP3_9SAUR|nr:Perilipin-3 [Platysternon megacephalum]
MATVCSAVSGAKHSVDMAKEVVHNSIETATAVAGSNVNKLMGSSIGQILMSGIDAVLKRPEESIVHCPPMTDESLGIRNGFCRAAEPAELQHQAYQHSLAKMDHVEQMAQQALSQLQQTIDLIKYVKQGIDKTNCNEEATLSQSSGKPKGNEANDAAQSEQMKSHTLAMSCTTIQQLLSICLTLMPIIHGLPTIIQDKIQKVYHSMEELHICFSSAASFQELSHEVLN